jgi:hypothetical protein
MFVLWSNYTVVDPSSVYNYHNNKLCNWPHGETPEQFPSSPVTELGRTPAFL